MTNNDAGAWVEQRLQSWSAKWRDHDGTVHSRFGYASREMAYAEAIRQHQLTYPDQEMAS